MSGLVRRFVGGAALLALGTTLLVQAPAAAGTEGGGELRIVEGAEPRSLNPLLDINKPSQRPAKMVLDPLIEVDPALQLVDTGLVTGWELVDDLTWRFTVREGVTFHNGEPFDAEAAAFSVLAARDGGGAAAGYFQAIATATATSATEFEITTATPNTAIPASLNYVWALPPAHYAEVGPEAFGQAPVGTGPFVFDEWVPGQHATFVRNDDYWGGPAQLERVTWRWAPDDSARVALLQSGEADLVMNVPPTDVDSVEANDGTHIASVAEPRLMFIQLNDADPRFEDVRVRQALAHAVDRQTIVDALFGGNLQLETNIMPPLFDGDEGGSTLGYDPEESCRLLEEVGGDVTLPIYASIGRYTLDRELGEALAFMFEEACFTVERNFAETATFFNAVFAPEKVPGVYVGQYGVLYPHPDMVFRTFFYSTGVLTYCVSPELDERIDAAVGIADPDASAAAYVEIADYIVNELMCVVPLYNPVENYGVSDRVAGFEAPYDGYLDLNGVTVTG